MTIADWVLLLALTAFVAVWWIRRMPARRLVLLALGVVALGAGLVDLFGDRWQAAVGVFAALILLGALALAARRPARTDGLPFVTGTLLALPAVAAITAVIAFPVSPLPKPKGSDKVGVRDFELVDTSRTGVLGSGPAAPRRLLVRVWYPAGDVSGLKRRPYFTDGEAKSTARTMGELFGFPPMFTYARHVRTNSFVDAPLKPGAHDLPVVIYSHGYTSFAGQNTALFEHLASHGYVVFSLQHTHDSSATVFPDGTVSATDPGLKAWAKAGIEAGPPQAQRDAVAGATRDARLKGWIGAREQALATNDRITRSGVIWLRDRLFLHDQLQARAVPAPIVAIVASSRLDRVGEMGMSFGGATTGSLCMVDRRCAAGINLDGADFPFQVVDAAMPVPFLMFHSDLTKIYAQMGVRAPAQPRSFNAFSYEPLAASGGNPAIHRVWLKGAHHLGLSDFSRFVRRPLRDGLFGEAPAKVMIGTQNDFTLAFFDRYVRGKANGFPEKEMKTWGKWVSPADDPGLAAWWNARPEAERAALTQRINAARRQPEGR
jgi:predicted dienelactone hydrolase